MVRAGALHRTSSGKVQRQSCRKAWLGGELDVLAVERQGHQDDGRTALMPVSRPCGTSGRNCWAPARSACWRPLPNWAATRSRWRGSHHGSSIGWASRLSLTALFEHATVAALAARVAEALRDDAPSAAAPIVTVPRGQPLPVSLSQRRMWVIQQFNPASVAYNVEKSRSRLRGPLDHGLFQRVADRLVERHEGLRTYFRMEGTEPVQLILPSLAIQVEHIDLQALHPDGKRMAEPQQRFCATRGRAVRHLAHPPSSPRHVAAPG